ncbi:MAG: methylated-DNA--[protein]-cysteine S-methyltransferase [Bacteroidia bacterium]|nr:methylated-DNA--[protein]-cysteine S-methyltransferase [Bacteroidia bacterium]NNC85599.1 methylated-DNA--[protein]-cysteine S-methyltransferase [Bacteroidia bacterium]NNM16476.1 methylated-DNA--[protein]-cysteine S-methyltransferase [Bacteroidia bacterium]
MYYTAFYKSPIGSLEIKSDEKHVTSINFIDDNKNQKENSKGVKVLSQCKKELDEYFHGDRTSFNVPYKLYGTPFQEEVWGKLGGIPYGRTKSYKDIAQKIGSTKLSRAVGQTNSLNPIAIIVPCHRVIGSNGNLTGYAGGLERKKWLLEFELKVKQPKLF